LLLHAYGGAGHALDDSTHGAKRSRRVLICQARSKPMCRGIYRQRIASALR
jgi:hypothetical protein